MTSGFSLPALDSFGAAAPSGTVNRLKPDAKRRTGRAGSRQGAASVPIASGIHGGTDDPLLPDSLVDNGTDWKSSLNDKQREDYRKLGLSLYNATSQQEMAAAMRALQNFERAARDNPEPDSSQSTDRNISNSSTSGAISAAESEDEFKQAAMSFYKSEAKSMSGSSGFAAAQQAAMAAQLERGRKRAVAAKAAGGSSGRLIQTF